MGLLPRSPNACIRPLISSPHAINTTPSRREAKATKKLDHVLDLLGWLGRQDCLSCIVRWTMSLLIQAPFILPMRSGCAFKNSGCFILRAVAGLFSFSSKLTLRVPLMPEKLSIIFEAASSLPFLPIEPSIRFFSRLTRLRPGLPSFQLELLLLQLPLLSRWALWTIEKIFAYLRFDVLSVWLEGASSAWKLNSILLVSSSLLGRAGGGVEGGQCEWKMATFVRSVLSFCGFKWILDSDIACVKLFDGDLGIVCISIDMWWLKILEFCY